MSEEMNIGQFEGHWEKTGAYVGFGAICHSTQVYVIDQRQQ